MTNSREIAEQAFALLQDALQESESQRLDLEKRLQTSKPATSDFDEAFSALQAQLQETQAERDLWKKTSNQLQDVVSNERSKAKRLARKLGVVASGSDRVARREVNYWREKAESFEEARQKYQQRIYELKAELKQREEALDAQAASRVTVEEFEHATEMLVERDARISELGATLESSHLRNQQLERRIAELDSEVRSFSQQVIEAEAARNEACRAADLIDAELKDLKAHSAAHQDLIESLQQELDKQKSLNDEYRRRVDDLETQHDREISALRDAQTNEADALRESHAAEVAQLQTQRAELEQRFDAERTDNAAELARLRDERAEFEQRLESERTASTTELTTLREERAEFEQRLEAERSDSAAELAELREQRAELEQRLENERLKHAEQLEHRDAEQRAREQMHASALTKERADTAEAIRAEFEPRVAALTSQLDEQNAAFAALETELAEERNRSDNLNELANERRESLTRTTEKLEEMEERYEDAKWHLGKARHFERLVRRRRKLIANLIGTIRARQKANNSLKAGLDSLRRYKANADERQQEQLRRIEILENSLSEAKEKLAQANQARRVTDTSTQQIEHSASGQGATKPAGSDTMQLRNQVTAQAEVIENLEAELKGARVAETEARTKLTELEKLHDDLETKNTFIGTLQKDIEEHQKTLAQLRKRDIEVKELRNKLDEHERKLTSLQAENTQLRSAKSGEVEAIDRQKLADQDRMIGKLTTKLKEYEATITALNEAADTWKRKYDFLAAEAPYGYESASSK
jgi:chromosome segregation ATPase